ncbi:hypothetical protein J2T07_001833 [Luteibacter jiangsuensis]|uniref:Uncharacterized protein n=1 Tax=Luteibacter jiangsuensis TaxID=637577 RepID=A0ABT9SXB9_9GAMM|nr:hypothetical protein [Luteibacter jiangsuensis]MDQ0009656.1 hypothetical protein [Luteibacter jiangsuensis]
MKRTLLSAIVPAIIALAPGTAWSVRGVDLETFDQARAGIIQPGDELKLEHFRIAAMNDGAAVIKPVEQPDDLAYGLALGGVERAGPASVDIQFDKPLRSVAFTVVLPPGAPALASTATLYIDERERQSLALQHGTTINRLRLIMSLPEEQVFNRLSLQLQRGAYIDGVEMHSPPITDGTLIDFDELPTGTLQGLIDQGHYIILANSSGLEITASSDGETSGQVLGSTEAAGNDALLMYRTVRNSLDLTVVPDPSGEPATIEFLEAPDFTTLHSIRIDPASGPQRLSFTAPRGSSLQGMRWTGGKLRIDEVMLRSR